MFSTAADPAPDVTIDMGGRPWDPAAKHHTWDGQPVMRSKRERDEYAARTGKRYDKDAIMEMPSMRKLTEQDKKILRRSTGVKG